MGFDIAPIGGNQIYITDKEKFQITNQKGKVKTLSPEQFNKQLQKNADKLRSGDDFEFKRDLPYGKIGAGVATVAGITAAVVYRKNIKNFVSGSIPAKIKNSKFVNKTKEFFGGVCEKIGAFFKNAGEKIKSVFPKKEIATSEVNI